MTENPRSSRSIVPLREKANTADEIIPPRGLSAPLSFESPQCGGYTRPSKTIDALPFDVHLTGTEDTPPAIAAKLDRCNKIAQAQSVKPKSYLNPDHRRTPEDQEIMIRFERRQGHIGKRRRWWQTLNA